VSDLRPRPEADVLLVRRMVVLNLDRNEVAAAEPCAFRELQRLCTMCESHGRCVRDLARDPADGAWEGYCPNAAMLKVLVALRSLGRDWRYDRREDATGGGKEGPYSSPMKNVPSSISTIVIGSGKLTRPAP